MNYSQHEHFITISGTRKPGYRVASGMADNSPDDRGTIEMQLPCLRKQGLDLSGYFRGTLNIAIAPHKGLRPAISSLKTCGKLTPFLEAIASPIPDIIYSDLVQLKINSREIEVY